jgi:two-component system, NarL family, response regulator NreC
MKPRIILADDHRMVADGLGKLIAEFAELVATVSDGMQLVEKVHALHPDLVISDISMPLMSGLEALTALKSEPGCPPFIFLTVHMEPELCTRALQAGAQGYLLKQAAGDELRTAVQSVMRDERYVTRELYSIPPPIRPPGSQRLPPLSPRQQQVLRLLAQGLRMKDIARELEISVRTVEDHKVQLMRNVGARNGADLVRLALRLGFASG